MDFHGSFSFFLDDVAVLFVGDFISFLTEGDKDLLLLLCLLLSFFIFAYFVKNAINSLYISFGSDDNLYLDISPCLFTNVIISFSMTTPLVILPLANLLR